MGAGTPRRLAATALGLVLWASPAAAGAAPPLGLTACGPTQGVQQCSGLVASWDGVPLDTTVTLPPDASGPLPLVVEVNGFGNSKSEYLDPASEAYTGNAYGWARAGYAVLTATARGLWGSCGTPESRLASPAACARGYLHLADVRYEVRDIQELIGRLVDDRVADPDRIGVTGDSYGGGQTAMLAMLGDRVMLPDGTLEPWRSPAGTPLRLAAAAPVIPWTDLVGAIAPNGRALVEDPVEQGVLTTPVGVFKLSVANAIFAAAQVATGPGQPIGQPFLPGRPEGYLAPPGADPEADVASWVARSDLGEPYDDAGVRAIIARLERFHSAYGIPDGPAPPPLLVASGFTDDLFPVDEGLRLVARVRRDHPDVPVSVLLGDFGHQRAANKPADRARLLDAIRTWFGHYLRGEGDAPPEGVSATTQTCPRDRPSEGPFTAPTLTRLTPVEIALKSDRPQRVRSDGGDLQRSLAIDPATGGGDGCVQVPARRAPGTAVYDLDPAPEDGTLLLGAPRVTARLRVNGTTPSTAQLAAHLWDVAPGGATERLVARGTLRPSGGAQDVFELHANGWRFEKGHVARLELTGVDAPYARPSNASFTIDVGHLELHLPVKPPAGAPPVPDRARRRPAVRLSVRCTRAGLRAHAVVRNAAARHVSFAIGGRRVGIDRRAPYARTLGRHRRVTVTARAVLRNGRVLRARVRARPCHPR